MTPAETAVLGALRATPEGLTFEAMALDFNASSRYHKPSEVHSALDALVAAGRVWTLPMQTRRAGVVPLYFLAPETES